MFFGKKKKKEVKLKDVEAMEKRIKSMTRDMDMLTSNFLEVTNKNIEKVRR